MYMSCMQVVFSLKLTAPAHDGVQGSGKVLTSSAADAPCRLQLGAGSAPPGLEAALGSMSKGEKALFIIPVEDMQSEAANSSSSSRQQTGLSIPELPAKCVQVEATIELLDLVQVREAHKRGLGVQSPTIDTANWNTTVSVAGSSAAFHNTSPKFTAEQVYKRSERAHRSLRATFD